MTFGNHRYYVVGLDGIGLNDIRIELVPRAT